MVKQLNVWGMVTRTKSSGVHLYHFTTGQRPGGEEYKVWRGGVFLAGTYTRHDNPPHMADRYVWQYERQAVAPQQPDDGWVERNRPS